MKKIILITFLFVASISLVKTQSCTPNSSPCTNGASVVSFGGLCDTTVMDGYVNTPYFDDIQFFIKGICFDPNDIGVPPPIPGVTARITALNSFAFSQMPTGINGGTNQPSYTIPYNATVMGCGYFNGTPTQAGIFSCVITISASYTTQNCYWFTQTGTESVNYNISLNIHPNANFSGLATSYCANAAAVTLTPTGTTGGTFSGPGVSGNTFNPAIAGPGTHTITYTVSAQQGAAVAPSSNSSFQTVVVNPTYTYYVDTDGDGYGVSAGSISICNATAPTGYAIASGDCNNNNAAIHPGATEICDNIDNNCNSQTDEGLTTYTYYPDTDGDGYGVATGSITTCNSSAPTGYASLNGDCNNTNAAIHPGATEICDNIDNNCNGQIDEGLAQNTYYADGDGDGFGSSVSISTCSSTIPTGYVNNSTDCNDSNASINPNATEICDGIDNNCNGQIDEGLTSFTYYVDADGDAYGSTTVFTSCQSSAPSGYSTDNTDCNDNNASIHPGATDIPGNGIDEDCDGSDATIVIDNDMDGYDNTVDCNDNNVAINPGATEICDGVDNNCNGQIDEGLTSYTYYVDTDGDGYGGTTSITSCSVVPPTGYASNSTDCNNNNAAINPGATEICDGIDNNCNGQIDEVLTIYTYYLDTDGDGFGSNTSISSCSSLLPTGYVSNNTDCDDNNAALNPGATEICDGIDNNCNGQTDEGLTQYTYFADNDGDGYGGLSSITTCSPTVPTGYASNNTDCDDTNNAIHPGATEVCDGVDNDCNGLIDDGLTTYTYYLDADFDGYGTSDSTISSCNSNIPGGYANNNLDCDDVNDQINPNAAEVCNGLDDNCDGNIDEGLTMFTYYLDADNDGYGISSDFIQSCQNIAPMGYVANQDDCDDTNGNVNPASAEVCDNVDNNCDGNINENLTTYEYFEDSDGDGFGAETAVPVSSCQPSAPSGFSVNNTDCDDTNNTIYPGSTEIPNDGIDQDCDPTTTDIKESILLTNLAVYPNPSFGKVFIESTENKVQRVEIFNITGALVYSYTQAFNEHQLDLSKQSEGIYLLKLYDEQNEFKLIKMILIK